MKGRIFTPEFKLRVVKAVLSGEKRVIQLCREFSLSDTTIHTWKKLYQEKGETAFLQPTRATSEGLSPQEQELLALRDKVAQLERLVGQQALQLSVLKKMEELGWLASKNGLK